MQREDATKQAQAKAQTHGGTWYAVEKRHNFAIVRDYEYHTKLGRIIARFSPNKAA